MSEEKTFEDILRGRCSGLAGAFSEDRFIKHCAIRSVSLEDWQRAGLFLLGQGLKDSLSSVLTYAAKRYKEEDIQKGGQNRLNIWMHNSLAAL
jgi:hypothetical protein